MEKKWSKFWKSSVQTRKQRKYVHNAPLHVRHKMLSSPLSKELRAEYSIRSVPVRTGDFVEIIAGQFRGKSGKVTKVSVARLHAYVEGASVHRADGTDSLYPIHPSNLKITRLDVTDKLRVAKIGRARAK